MRITTTMPRDEQSHLIVKIAAKLWFFEHNGNVNEADYVSAVPWAVRLVYERRAELLLDIVTDYLHVNVTPD